MFIIDLNGLISTVAASTAAIVAIVGGLLISRLLALSSEKNGVVRRIKELQVDFQIKKKQSEELSEWLLWEDAKDFIREHGREIIMNGTDYEGLIDPEVYPYRSKDELRPFIQKLIEVMNDFFNIIEQSKESEGFEDDFDDFYKNRKTKLSFPDRRFYYETIFKLFDLETTRNTSPFRISISNLAELPSTNGMEYREKKLDSDRLDGEITYLQHQIDVEKKNLITFGRPDGLWSGLLVIIYACTVGVIWPVSLLPYTPNIYNDHLTKWVVLGCFYSALFALFFYLFWSTYRLTKK